MNLTLFATREQLEAGAAEAKARIAALDAAFDEARRSIQARHLDLADARRADDGERIWRITREMLAGEPTASFDHAGQQP